LKRLWLAAFDSGKAIVSTLRRRAPKTGSPPGVITAERTMTAVTSVRDILGPAVRKDIMVSLQQQSVTATFGEWPDRPTNLSSIM
jgi:hypothetical protein